MKYKWEIMNDITIKEIRDEGDRTVIVSTYGEEFTIWPMVNGLAMEQTKELDFPYLTNDDYHNLLTALTIADDEDRMDMETVDKLSLKIRNLMRNE